ncbi:MAG: TerC family protein [Gemmatimonadetes bacterium]|nr:TerC family protein [Gemmatimonadota bacterium]NNF12813.1 TerC family protein [Gemmatimonadota bacterium]
MTDLLLDPAAWMSLFGITLIQIALGADNLIIITIIANKLPAAERHKAIRWGLILAMLFRIVLLFAVSLILAWATVSIAEVDMNVLPWAHVSGDLNGKALVLAVGGLFLIWKGIKELRIKLKGVEDHVAEAARFSDVVAVIVGMNLLFSVDSILTVVGMTDLFPIMVGSVVISVALMLAFAAPISAFLSKNPEFEILGLFVLLLIGFVLVLEGGHTAHLEVNGTPFPYIPQWIVIFMLVLMFSVDLYQNWWERTRGRPEAPIALHHRKS